MSCVVFAFRHGAGAHVRLATHQVEGKAEQEDVEELRFRHFSLLYATTNSGANTILEGMNNINISR